MDKDMQVSMAEIEDKEGKVYILFLPDGMDENQLSWYNKEFRDEWQDIMDHSKLIVAYGELDNGYELIESSKDIIQDIISEDGEQDE
jgi:hypothetical protein